MLTAKQEAYALLLFKGVTQYDAYRTAYNVTTENRAVTDIDASRVANSPKIRLRLAELRNQAAKPTIMSVTRRKERLSELAEGNKVTIPAIAELNKMEGSYEASSADKESSKAFLELLRELHK